MSTAFNAIIAELTARVARREYSDWSTYTSAPAPSAKQLLQALAELAEAQLTAAAATGDPAGVPDGWRWCVIDDEGRRGWACDLTDRFRVFAWGGEAGSTGGWALWLLQEDGELDAPLFTVEQSGWTTRQAVLAAHAELRSSDNGPAISVKAPRGEPYVP